MTIVLLGLETDKEGLQIAGEAPQHSDDEPLKLHKITDCKIPKKTAHAYQPAYQFIITAVKACVCCGWDAWVEDIFARNSNDTTRLLLKCLCLTCLRYESVNVLYS